VLGLLIQSEDEELNYLLDPWALIDVAVILILAFFIFRKSRVAATLMVVYFVIGKLVMWYQIGKPQGLIMMLVFLAFYSTAMRGTFLWHAKYRNQAQAAGT
jgi:ABC-type proline/glycine betaine transport system permease subunit